MDRCIAWAKAHPHPELRDKTIWKVFEAERPNLVPYVGPFDGFHAVPAFPGARHQRCWVHKVSNMLNKFLKSMAPTVKSDLRDIWQTETRAAAEAAIDVFAKNTVPSTATPSPA